MQTSQNGLGAVTLLVCPTLFAHSACIRDWFEASTHAHFEMLHMGSDLHNHTRALVACTLGAEI